MGANTGHPTCDPQPCAAPPAVASRRERASGWDASKGHPPPSVGVGSQGLSRSLPSSWTSVTYTTSQEPGRVSDRFGICLDILAQVTCERLFRIRVDMCICMWAWEAAKARHPDARTFWGLCSGGSEQPQHPLRWRPFLVQILSQAMCMFAHLANDLCDFNKTLWYKT